VHWPQLLSRKRISHHPRLSPPPAEAGRSDFERDWDRILFSTAFRRLHDKTQVFPLPDDDVVHSRLTHSLEVASVGRSLGKLVGAEIAKRHGIVPDGEFNYHDVGDIVAAACLAHDIGNPPFGHCGEDAIATFFRSTFGAALIVGLTDRERADLQAFEGNAQGFRLVTRLQQEVDGGLQLTTATLAAFAKYPRDAGADLVVSGRASTKKHGYFQHDAEIFGVIANEVGLIPQSAPSGARRWCRHPLAFVVEAADDVCYSVLDIEDGVRLRLVPAGDAEELLRIVASKARAFSPDRLAAFTESKGQIGYLRALAIGRLIEESCAVFLDAERSILDGAFDTSLSDAIPSKTELKALKELARVKCYEAPEVIEIELAGYEALGGLLEHFIPAVVAEPSDRAARPEREKKALQLLEGRGVDVGSSSLYERLLRVTDFVSGMTDRHALATYRRLKGIAIPGRAG
jgi:dGTPase